jgi:hypothetical protein
MMAAGLGDAHEPEEVSAEDLAWFEEECPPVPAEFAFRWHEKRQRFYLRWIDENGERHGIPLPHKPSDLTM